MARRASRGHANARSLLRGMGWSVMLLTPISAHGQDEDQPQQVLDLPREGYEAPDHRLGPFVVSATARARIEYDNNIFAQNVDRTEDALVTFQPAVKAELSNERVSWVSEARGSIYRYLDNASENHEGYALASRVALSGGSLSLGGRIGFERTFESRNDPEARRQFGAGPRLFTLGVGELFAGVEGNRTGLVARVTAEKYNFLSPFDDDRDFTSYQASLRAKYRLTGRINLFAQAYLNRRDFRLGVARAGVNRDGTSKAALLGIAFDPRGKLRGEIAAGILRFTPKDPAQNNYTGWELRGALVYQPRTRTAITLDAFRGDVATARLGATGRIDSRVRLGIQQEARHNLLLSAGVGWRKTRFRGIAGQAKKTLSADGEVEYLLNRHASVALTAQYVDRSVERAGGGSSAAGRLRSPDAFSRFRAGVELRFKF